MSRPPHLTCPPSSQAFMSTTKDEAVALSYAASSDGAGFVFEIPQGMVDRGADIGFLSQVYEHCAAPSPSACLSFCTR